MDISYAKMVTDLTECEAERDRLKKQVVDLAQKLITIVVENLKMINMAGEAIGTDPSLRTSACVEVLAQRCKYMEDEWRGYRSVDSATEVTGE